MNVMEYELHECSFEDPPFSFQFNEDSLSPNTTPTQDQISEKYMERLLQIETDLMDFTSIDSETNEASESCQDELMEGCSLTDLLLMGAEAVESQNSHLSSVIIQKLNQILFHEQNDGNSFNRLAFFFTQSLYFKSINAPKLLQNSGLNQTEAISSFQLLQELSPYVKFAHFTANQAILEATKGDQQVHIIDFDIMEGIQWPPLMVDLAIQKDAFLRITAIVSDKGNAHNVQKTGIRLKEFADSINLAFIFDQFFTENESDFEKIQVDHPLIANCMTNQIHIPKKSFTLVQNFLMGMRKLSPKIVVLVEDELFNVAKTKSMTFVEFFCEGIHHYNAIYESLVSSFCDGYNIGLRKIENEFLGVSILQNMMQFPCGKNEKILWENGFDLLEGFKRIPISISNISQAKFLVSLFRGAYWVQHENCRLGLGWKSRPLITASIWVPLSKPR